MLSSTKKMTLGAMFLALGLILPFFTSQIPQIGSMLLPMHLPVFLCGLICGWKYGLLTGLLVPILRSALFGMPVMFPVAIGMSFELAVYGGICGFLYNRSKWQCVWALIKSMVAAMILGRLAYGLAMTAMMGLTQGSYTWQMFITGTLINGIPGIILQFVLIPAIMLLLHRTGLVPFRKTEKKEGERVLV